MQHVDIDDVAPTSFGDSELDRRGLSDPLGTTDLAINRYALAPGEAFAGAMHTHLDQEEVFYVVDGTATFETKPDPNADSETVEVDAGEAIRFAPGEFQQGRNESDEQVVALALGAPRDSTDGRVARPCPECGNDVLAVAPTPDGMAFECPECSATLEP